MKNLIHHTAIIHKGANIDHNVSIGPYSVIGPNVKIGKKELDTYAPEIFYH